MPETNNEQIKAAVNKIDTLDTIEDSQVTLNDEKIDEYTETYITKVDELLASLDKSDLEKSQKEAIKKDLLQMLTSVEGKEELEAFESEFRGKIDQFLEVVRKGNVKKRPQKK